jgi:hypothetical protein
MVIFGGEILKENSTKIDFEITAYWFRDRFSFIVK